jgi:hypothetical protein
VLINIRLLFYALKVLHFSLYIEKIMRVHSEKLRQLCSRLIFNIKCRVLGDMISVADIPCKGIDLLF